MNFDTLFILTYNRSGSTLLQGVLNSIPGVLIRGENNAALRGLIGSWNRASSGRKLPALGKSSEPVDSWYGIAEIDLDAYGRALVEVFTREVLRPKPETQVIGFKEIRYFPVMAPNLNAEMQFMRRFFPRPGFVINTRNIEDTIDSAVNKKKHNISAEQIRASDERLRAIAGSSMPDVFHVHYDDYRDKPHALASLFHFLGASFDREKVEHVLSVRHSD